VFHAGEGTARAEIRGGAKVSTGSTQTGKKDNESNSKIPAHDGSSRDASNSSHRQRDLQCQHRLAAVSADCFTWPSSVGELIISDRSFWRPSAVIAPDVWPIFNTELLPVW
jgi:hypothetical protein